MLAHDTIIPHNTAPLPAVRNMLALCNAALEFDAMTHFSILFAATSKLYANMALSKGSC